MEAVLKSKWSYRVLWTAGFLVLVAYFALTGDWRFSWTWSLVMPAIALAVACVLQLLRLDEHLPYLKRYLCYPAQEQSPTPRLSGDEWALKYADYLQSGLPAKKIPLAVAEDGLICVMVLLAGITPLSAVAAGLIFGLLHIARFNYLECIGKALYYSLAIYFVLPHGLLTFAIGHMLIDVIAVIGLRIAKQKLIAKVRSNNAFETDAVQRCALHGAAQRER